MSLTINARFLTQPRSGVQRYAEEICRALDTLLVEDPAHAARLGPVRARLPAGSHRDPGWRVIALTPTPGGTGHFWEQGALARAARAEVLVSLGNSRPLLHPCQIVAFHDSHLWDMPEAYDWRYRAWHRALRPRLARRARAIAALLALPDRERAERRRAGQAQALRYSWHASALRLLELVAAA